MASEINLGYLKSKKGILKIVESLVTCVAFASMMVANKGTCLRGIFRGGSGVIMLPEYYFRFDFFIAIHLIGFIAAMLIFVVHFISPQEPVGSAKIWNILNLVFCVLLLILCAVTGALMIKYPAKEIEFWSKAYSGSTTVKWPSYTDHCLAAIAFSFISTIVFIVDAIFQFLELRTMFSGTTE